MSVQLSHSCARHLRRVLFDHGDDRQRQLWISRLENAPRYEPDPTLNPCPAPDPWPDDNLGTIGEDLRCALLANLHIEVAQHLTSIGDPSKSEDAKADAANDYAYFLGLIHWIEKWT